MIDDPVEGFFVEAPLPGNAAYRIQNVVAAGEALGNGFNDDRRIARIAAV